MIPAYPLHWPPTMPRSKSRERGTFKTTLAGALDNVERSIELFGKSSGKAVRDIVLSSNCSLGNNRPADPGIAAWFTWDGEQFCIPVDRYDTPEANLQAIHHVIEARRVELRHGTLALVKATFRGFKALPAPADQPHWTKVLDLPIDAKRDEVQDAYRRLAAANHPDRGGDHAAMAKLNAARDEALQAIGP